MESGEARRANIQFVENDIKLAVRMLDELTPTLEVLYYLLDHRRINSYVLLLVSAEEVDVYNLLNKEKRNTDLLFCIDEKEKLHALLCQETKVDGGYMFSERILRRLSVEKGKSIYCTVLEVRSSSHKIKDTIFRALEIYLKAKEDGLEGQISIKALQ